MRAPYRLIFAATACFAAFQLGQYAGQQSQAMPRLIGYGCQGASGPIYAQEESDFPLCASIEPLGN